MSDRKIIAVVGATGSQGGGLVRAIQSDPRGEFRARAITRDVNSPRARQLAELGAEVVAGDVDDAESLRRAFAGAHGAYCVTFYWAHMSPEREMREAETLAEAAKTTGVRHAIWSTLEDTRRWAPLSDRRMPTLMEHYKVPHFDAKGESNRFFSERGVPTTFLLTSFYWDNFINFGMGPQPDASGQLAITFPMGSARLPGIAAEDIGRCAYGIFKRGEDLIGQFAGIAGEFLTGSQMAAAFTRALGRDVRYNEIDPAVYRGFGFPGADDLGNMFQLKRDFNAAFCAGRDIGFSRKLNPALQTFDEWLAENKERITIPARAAA